MNENSFTSNVTRFLMGWFHLRQRKIMLDMTFVFYILTWLKKKKNLN